jgi:siroheme synthase (precorrin-2 oxidase/ferrochelatase)
VTVVVSTVGKSPSLPVALRRQIEASLGAEWDTWLEPIASLRGSWRNAGHDRAAVA